MVIGCTVAYGHEERGQEIVTVGITGCTSKRHTGLSLSYFKPNLFTGSGFLHSLEKRMS